MAEDTLNGNMDAMPGVRRALSPHRLRVAFGSYGKKFGGFADGEDVKLCHTTSGYKGAEGQIWFGRLAFSVGVLAHRQANRSTTWSLTR